MRSSWNILPWGLHLQKRERESVRGVLAKAQRSEPTAQFAVLIRGRQWPCLRRQPAVKLSVQSLAVAGYINPFSPTRRGTKLLLGAHTILAAIVRGGRRGLVRWSAWPADPSDPPHSPPIQAYSMLQTVKGGVRVAGINPTHFPQRFVSRIWSLHPYNPTQRGTSSGYADGWVVGYSSPHISSAKKKEQRAVSTDVGKFSVYK